MEREPYFIPMSAAQEKNQISRFLTINEKTRRFGLALTEEQALALNEAKKGALAANGRLELIPGTGVIEKIIMAFCDSVYIGQHNYVETMEELLEAFYYFKNETVDAIGDDDLIQFMRRRFDTVCQGSVELLLHRELETLAYCVKHQISLEEYEAQEADDLENLEYEGME